MKYLDAIICIMFLGLGVGMSTDPPKFQGYGSIGFMLFCALVAGWVTFQNHFRKNTHS